MNIEVEKGRNKLVFRLSAESYDYISLWEFSIDNAVFEEQLSTQMFRGSELDKDLLAIMHKAKQEGRILPYYGVGGSRGACIYSFEPAENQCQLWVQHSATDEVLEVSASLEVVEQGLYKTQVSRFKFSPLPHLLPSEELPKAWQREPDTQLDCPIVDKEYATLKEWEHWEETQAITGRYKYIFGTVSLGNGFTIKVRDKPTDIVLDITNYDDW